VVVGLIVAALCLIGALHAMRLGFGRRHRRLLSLTNSE